MVRRHRIADEELFHIINACYRRFVEVIVGYEINAEAESLFRFLWRTTKHKKGNPHYPILDPGSITRLIREIERKFDMSSYLDEIFHK
ncbi:hypothetical protein ACFL0D_09335 [Thermoproteota archaeon]